MANSKSNAIPLHEATEADYGVWNRDDRDIANRVLDAMTVVQEAMDEAVLAGLILDPTFPRIENRLTQCGARIDSHVCRIGIYRKLA